MTDLEVQLLATVVARRLRKTPGTSALSAWSAAVYEHGHDNREVDRTWPMVRDALDAAEFERIHQ